ncbi:MAG: hypothetical protein ACE5JU_15690 [Candidatus Binatia bacterium]
MQRSWTDCLPFLVTLCLIFFTATGARAKRGYGYSASGNLGTSFNYTRNKQEDRITWTFERANEYTLGLRGVILDPRLANFNISGAISTNDSSFSQREATSSQRYSLSSNITLLSGKKYPLDLRFSRSHSNSKVNTDLFSFGGSWRIIYGALPRIVLNFDRVNAQSTGKPGADTTFTTSTVNLVKRLGTSDVEAEIGLQHFADEVRETSTLRHFGRVSDRTRWSKATTLRFLGNYFSSEGNLSIGSSFSLINRPDVTLSRSLGLAIRNSRSKEQSRTNVEANGALTKSYQPFESLSATPFARALLSRRFASGEQGGSIQTSWSMGVSLVSSYFRSVLATAGYGLGISYANEDEGESTLGRTHQLQVGLESRTLYPYRIRGDYTLSLEQALIDRITHRIALRADAPIKPTLFIRSYAQFLADDAESSDSKTSSSTKQRMLTLGGGLSYTGFRQAYFDLGANATRSNTEIESNWLTQITANLNYRPRERLTLMLNGLRETDRSNDKTRYEVSTRLVYRFGRMTVNFDYRFDSSETSGQFSQGHSVSIRINRPFRFSF